MRRKIMQVATAVALENGIEFKRTVVVDNEGTLWELVGSATIGSQKWKKLPELPTPEEDRS